MALSLSLLWLAVVAVLLFRAIRQRNAFAGIPSTSGLRGAVAPSVAVVIPARNEAANIGPCLASVVAQDYDALRVIVIDDDSSDATADIVRSIAEHHPHVQLIDAPPLPPGWTGKVNACCAGAAAVDADWLCFLDADMRCDPQLMASAAATAVENGIDCLSLSPRHELYSFAERLMIPCGLFMLSFSQNLARIQSADSDEVTVTGQFMMIRRGAYEAVGGHAAVHGDICEDYELGARLKRNGWRVQLRDGARLLSTRMYTGWRDLWPGIGKNLVRMFGGWAPTVATGVVAVLIAWAALLVPLYDGIGCYHSSTQACVALAPALAASAAVFALHIAGTGYFGIPVIYGVLFPLGYTIGVALACDGMRRILTGRITWKGRVYQ